MGVPRSPYKVGRAGNFVDFAKGGLGVQMEGADLTLTFSSKNMNNKC